MHPYIVHLERRNVRDWMYRGNDGRDRLAFIPNSVKIECDLDNQDFHDMESWYCRTAPEAAELAKYISSKFPGRNVNVYKLEMVAQSPAAPPVIAKYSEKGLIPE